MAKKNRRKAAAAAPAANVDSKKLKEQNKITSPFTCTGALRKQCTWNDIIIDSFTLSFFGKELISDSTFQVSAGRRYGLVGSNGSGKSRYPTGGSDSKPGCGRSLCPFYIILTISSP